MMRQETEVVISYDPFVGYDPGAAEYRPRLKLDHPYRTMTRFMRDATGMLVRDVTKLLDDDDVMVEVAPNRFVNEVSARALSLVGEHNAAYLPRKLRRNEEEKVPGEGCLVPMPLEKDQPRDRSTTREERAAGRARAALKAEEELKAMKKELRRIKKRQRIGNPDCPRSRDEDFPLLAVLRRDKLQDYIRVVLEYRRLFALCEAEPLKGQAYGANEPGMAVAYVSRRMTGLKEVNEAAAAGFPGSSVPGGEIIYERKVRKSKGAYDIPAVRKKNVDVDAYFEGDGGTSKVGTTESLHIRVTEDVLLDRIDRAPILAKIRAALGPLLEPFEDAVLGGQTLQSVGNTAGFFGRDATSAGKALVLQGVAVADRFLGSKKYAPANDNYLIAHRKVA